MAGRQKGFSDISVMSIDGEARIGRESLFNGACVVASGFLASAHPQGAKSAADRSAIASEVSVSPSVSWPSIAEGR